MEISMYIVWSVILIVAVVIELNTLIQIGWAASIGAGVALITHAITKGDPAWIEFIVFFITWAMLWLLLLVFRKQIKRIWHDKEDGYLVYVGNVFSAHKGNESGFGEIKINDKFFRFTCDDKIEKGTKVKLIKIKGVTFKVVKGNK